MIMSSSDDSHIYQLKITLDDIQPSIWRRIQVPGDVSLFKLHFILQIAMGWTNSHLHEFIIGERNFGNADPDSWRLLRGRAQVASTVENGFWSNGFWGPRGSPPA